MLTTRPERSSVVPEMMRPVVLVLATALAGTRAWSPRPALGRRAAPVVAGPPSLGRRAAPALAAAPTLNEWGLGLKDSARAKAEAARGAPTRAAGLKYGVEAAAFSAAFVAYRAYRGFFVVLPAVFIQVREKLREGRPVGNEGVGDDIDPKTGKLKLRSAILMNIGAGLVLAVLAVKALATALFFIPKVLANLALRRQGPAGGGPSEEDAPRIAHIPTPEATLQAA